MPALNASSTIEIQLRALADQEYDGSWEVIVVDNGSVDDTPQVCRAFQAAFPRLRLIECATPGTSAARNAGSAVATGALLLFVDADDQAAPGWLTAMVDALREHDSVGGAIENEQLNPRRPPDRPRHPDHLPVTARFLPRAITANFGVRREVFDAVGGFNEEYEFGGPDTEFSWRLQLAGYELSYEPSAVVHYRHRDSLRGAVRKSFRTGRAHSRLFRDYRSHGMHQPKLLGGLAQWASIVAGAPLALLVPSRRWSWATRAASAAGRLSGSIRYRVRYI